MSALRDRVPPAGDPLDWLRGRRIGFYRTGSFSHVNGHVLDILRRSFPECEVEDIDAEERVTRRSLSNLVVAACEYGLHRVRGLPADLRHLARRNPRYALQVRDFARRHTRSHDFAFTVQTQSLWDAGTPGVPHFVYTDHTHLANRRYSGSDGRARRGGAAIRLERSIYANARITFVTSRFAERSLIEDYGCDPARVECVYSGINIDVDGLPVRHSERKNILFVGVDWERKGGPELLQAFRRVLAEHPDAELTIVGCRPDVTLPNCTVVGRVSREEVGRYYADAAVFCLPSLIEPSAVALVEASAHGVPVVATDVGGTSDRVLDGVTGRLVPPGDIPRLAAALSALLQDAGERRKLGEQGRRHVLEFFTWRKVGEAMTRSIRTALAAAPEDARRRRGLP